MTKTFSITEEEKEREGYRLADGVDKRRSQDMINLAEREPLGLGSRRGNEIFGRRSDVRGTRPCLQK